MTAFQRFEDIQAWQVSRELVNSLYRATDPCKFGPDIDLRGQLTSAGVSVMTNIAEGFGRGNDGDFIRFLDIARGSAAEVQSLVYVCADVGYLSEENAAPLRRLAADCISLVAGLQTYLKQARNKGRKRNKAGKP
jgi:four helix bundle protein